jgi:hypothetical protein
MSNAELRSESRQNRADRYINQLERHIEKAEDHKKYSSDRFDILSISISTTALIFSIGFVKDIVKNYGEIDKSDLKIAWLLLSITICLNFISQLVSYYAHDIDIRISENIIRRKRGYKVQGNQNKYEKICNFLSILTEILNWSGLLGIILGISKLVVFFSNNL